MRKRRYKATFSSLYLTKSRARTISKRLPTGIKLKASPKRKITKAWYEF